MKMRKGREFYGKNYEEAMKLYEEGLSITDVAKKLDISYSAAYHWVKGIRKPEEGNINLFVDFVKKHGPIPVIELANNFPKHNELFLIAVRRGLHVKRFMMQKKLSDYSIWYYIEGQESELKIRTDALIEKINEIKRKLAKSVDHEEA